MALDTLTDVTLTERANGTGTITFGPTPAYWGCNGPAGWPGGRSIPMFDLAEGARQVYEKVRDARRAAIRQGLT